MSKKKNKFIPELRFPKFKNEGKWEYDSDLPILAITQEQGAVPREIIKYHVSVTEKSIESYKVVEIGDFIISLRSFQGGIEYSNYLGLCSPAYTVLRKKENVINDFYRHYFKSYAFIQDLNRNLEGIRDGKMISYKQFSEILIPKPKLKEQEEIAFCLTSIDEVISANNAKLELLKDHKKGLFQSLFPQEKEKVPKYRFKEFAKDGEWKKTRIEEIAKVTTGGTPESTNPEYWNGDIPWMNSGELNNKRIHSVSNFITYKGLKESSTKLIPPLCILIGLAGQGKTRGTAAINYIKLCTNQSIASIHPNKDVFDSEFLYQLME